jgi:hypothetical protein
MRGEIVSFRILMLARIDSASAEAVVALAGECSSALVDAAHRHPRRLLARKPVVLEPAGSLPDRCC